MARATDAPSNKSKADGLKASKSTPARPHAVIAADADRPPVETEIDVQITGQLERLEHALSRAPGAASTIEAATAQAEQILQGLETGAENIERGHAALQERLSGLDHACTKADQVERALSDFVSQLADVGDASEGKITLLLETLDAGRETRQNLQKVIADAARHAERLESKANEQTSRLADLATSQFRTLDDSIRQHTIRLTELSESGVHGLEKASREHLAQLDSSRRSQETRSIAAADRSMAELKHTFEMQVDDIRRHQESIREHAAKLAEVAETSQRDVQEDMREHAEKLTSIARARLEQLAAATNEGISALKLASAEPIAEIRKREESVRQCAAQLTEAAATSLRGIQESASEHSKQLKSIVHTQEERLAAAANENLTALKQASAETIAEIRKREESVRECAARVGETVDARLLVLEEAARTHREMLESVADAQNERLATAVDQGVADLKEAFNTQVAEVRIQQDAIRQHAADLNELADSRTEGLEESARSCTDRLASVARAQESRLTELAEQCIARVKQAMETQLAEITQQLELELAPYAADGAHAKRLAEMVSQGTTQIDTAAKRRFADVEAAVKRQTGLLQQAAESKSEQLASQLQAAHEAVRMVSNSTRDAHAALSEMIENRDAVEVQAKATIEATERASTAAAELQALQDQVGPSIDSLREAAQGSSSTTTRIEQLIQEVRALTTSVQQHAGELSERCDNAAGIIETIDGALRDTEARTSALAEQNATGYRRAEELRQATERTEELIRHIDEACEQGSRSVVTVKQAADSAQTTNDVLAASLSGAQDVLQQFDGALATSRDTSERIRDQSRSAEQIIEKLDSGAGRHRALARELHASLERGQGLSKHMGAALAAGSEINDQLTSLTDRADKASRDVTQTLAALTERQEMLESSDRALNEFLERAERTRTRLQQLQTRADAFQHQLNSMLADPRKIIDDAKSQAGQLDSVCGAVRKIFAGLSQASLQANRDITRFARISREANGRLTQISAETQRAGQSLREWIDEAAHVQSRLAKSLALAPPISQTHPTTALDDLARSSAEAIPEILKPPNQEYLRGRRSALRKADSPPSVPEPAHNKSDFGALIREAESLAEATS